jgi:hypothetical protein
MFGSEKLTEKWSPVLDAEAAAPIKDNYRKAVTAALLENTEKALQEQKAQQGFMTESNVAGQVDNFDPVLISLVLRAMPNLIAYDIAGVQPMSGPTGLIFAMKSEYVAASDGARTEALFDEAKTDFSGTGTHGGNSSSLDATFGNDLAEDFDNNAATADTTDGNIDLDAAFGIGTGDTTANAEGSTFGEMAFSIDRTSVTAVSRQLKAEYTMELAQDLKAVHGLDAETELANILSAEILAEVNREVIRTINIKAKLATKQAGDVTTTGTADVANGHFDLDATDGRWSVEKYKSLIMKIEIEANAIAKDTRRGKGNFIICSSDVASALAASGLLDYTPALSTNLQVDDTGNTFAGVLNGRMKVYIDPYATVNYVTVGYRGSNPYDAGLFYCPYVPLTMVKAVGENTFQPKIGFKTRYGMVANPFVTGQNAAGVGTVGTNRQNGYFRIFGVSNVIGASGS